MPIRIELGERDLAQGVATLVRRDKEFKEPGQKTAVARAEVVAAIGPLLAEIQTALYAQAAEFLREHTISPASRDEFYRACRERAGMIEIAWCERPECEAHVKAETGATTRNVRRPALAATCLACGEPALAQAYFAQSY